MGLFQKNRCFAKTIMLVAALAVCIHGTTAQAQVITDYSNFSESGNMLNSASHNREQNFSVDTGAVGGPTITITNDAGTTVTAGTASQEIYGSTEFTAATTQGYRLQVDLVDIDFQVGSSNTERVGLVVADSVPMGGPTSGDVRNFYFYWVYRADAVMAGLFNDFGEEEEASPIQIGNVGEVISGLYMERVIDESNGPSWDLGYIDTEGNDVFVQNRAAVNGVPIETTGDVIGIYSDLRTDTSSYTLQNLSYGLTGGSSGDFNNDGTVDGTDFIEWQRDTGIGNLADWQATYGDGPSISAVPEPVSMLLLGIGMLPVFTRRTR